ncbi:hypothetical protein PR048_032670 [Dryococelus australis]|uniref:Reverse transcriptase RNase H-like domain-containing protein n=1 Tax=Dryococelus australis TaxID=614101 RepID=A0ABQ9G2V3_9NEOP|nr:hypothetical protein PR048_032670 [Dryococelus australis]
MKDCENIAALCRHFWSRVNGYAVQILTNHKSLIAIINKQVFKITSPQLQYLKLKRLKYHLHIQYFPGNIMHITDLLSQTYNSKEEVENDKKIHSILKVIHKGRCRVGKTKATARSTHRIPKIVIADNMLFCLYKCPNITHKLALETHMSGHITCSEMPKISYRKARREKSTYWLPFREYRNTQFPGLEVSSSEFLMSSLVRTSIPVNVNNLLPKVKLQLVAKPVKVKKYYDTQGQIKTTEYVKGQRVVVQNGRVWKPAKFLTEHHVQT